MATRLTLRGKIVLGIAIALVLGGFTHLTRDTCWIGPEPWAYGSCQKMIDRMVAQTLNVPTPSVDKLEEYRKAETLSPLDLAEMLYLVGFREGALKNAWAIAMRESNGRPLAHNANVKTGDNSYGVFQINMIGSLGVDRRDLFNISHNSNLFDPVMNAEIAFYMSKGGTDWSSWKGITPRAQKFLRDFPIKDLQKRIARYSQGMSIPAYRLREVIVATTNLRALMSDLSDEQLVEAEKVLSNALMSVNLEIFHREKEKESSERREVASV